jgi:hypothetical protein
MRPYAKTLLVVGVMMTSTAQADLNVKFVEGAPKDRFRIENTGTCDIQNASLSIDLSSSQGGLIFDVTSEGAGVEVFQPFEIVEGREAVSEIPAILDGQSNVTLEIEKLQPNQVIVFTIDVDDTLGQREITVTGSEIKGGSIGFETAQRQEFALFSSGSLAEVTLSDC